MKYIETYISTPKRPLGCCLCCRIGPRADGHAYQGSWTIGFSAWLYPRGVWRGRKVREGPFYSQKPLISLFCPYYPWCLCRTLMFPRWREQLRCTYACKTPPPVGTVHASCPTPESWHQSLLPKLTVLQARLLPPCMPWQSYRSTKSRHSNRWMRVVLIQDSCRSCIQKITFFFFT